MTHRAFLFLLSALVAGLLGVVPSANAQIPQNEYLRHVPLRYPRIVRQTEMSARFLLYGDRKSASFRDESPKDGIDDERGLRLGALTTRFAPIMIRNSPQFPIDFRTFYDRDSFPIFVERWDIARASFSLVDSAQIDMARLAGNPCPAGGDAGNQDCRLRDLIEQFGPERQSFESVASPEQEVFNVIHFDFPGFDEKTWKREYSEEMRPKYLPAARTFAHPFIAEVPSPGGAPGFEFVIQYWFFYPANDGPNNHEGDWEHINVVVSPLSKVNGPLDAADIEGLLTGATALDGSDPVVLRRIEYYLHHFVYRMDFASPNVYQPRADWEREARTLAPEEGARRVLNRIRRRAWQDAAETTINTRPIVWIGGDAIGVQSVLQTPGLHDRDGHASYPFRGYYKRIGVGQVSERVVEAFDHVEYFGDPGRAWNTVEDYGNPGRIVLTPDWEHVLDLVMSDPAVRRDWSWLVLPLRYGYPATPSPGAGLAAHADLGNVAVVGPSYNDGWNRIGDSAGYDSYELLEAYWATPLGMTDSFFPRLGFLNAPILYFLFKPPLDLAWRTLALPVRATLGSRQPTFLPASAPAERSVSFEVGSAFVDVSDDFVTLFFNRDQLLEIAVRTILALPPGSSGDLSIAGRFGWATTPVYSLVFHLSPRFSAESSFVWYETMVGFDVTAPGTAPIRTRGDFNHFDFQGAMRVNLMTGSFQPYATYGHGLTSYKLKNVNVDGVPLTQPDSERFRPQARWWNFGFNETIFGGGIDWNDVRAGPAWLGLKASYSWTHHDIGFERSAAVEVSPTLATLLAGQKFAVWRQQGHLLLSVSF